MAGGIGSRGARAAAEADWRSVGVLVLHGIGATGPGYSYAFQNRVTDMLPKKQRARVRWSEVYWGDVTRANQLAYLRQAASQSHKLGGVWGQLREWVGATVADAAAYHRSLATGQSVFDQVQLKVAQGIENLLDRHDPRSPLVIVAHCLGGHIISTYITDRQQDGQPGPTKQDALLLSDQEKAFLALRTLSGIVTLGTSIPLFTFASPKPTVTPVGFPPLLAEDDPIATKRRWINFYAQDDILGYPLRPINQAYWKAVSEDVCVRNGWTRGATPATHVLYWRNQTVCRRIAKLLSTLITTPYPKEAPLSLPPPQGQSGTQA